MGKAALQRAMREKNDEFFTCLPDIVAEMAHYEPLFKDQSVYLPCDHPFESAFSKFFTKNFDRLGLKKLTMTHYVDQQCQLWVEEGTYPSKPRKLEYVSGHGHLSPLNENGDFRSGECMDIWREADIIVTNPPFSLMGDFFDRLIKYNKKFLLIGPLYTPTRSNIWPWFQEGFFWYGHYRVKEFRVPGQEETKKLNNVCWFTNLGSDREKPFVKLTQDYDAEKHPRYDNYNAIYVETYLDLPRDYEGAMGVSLSFLPYFNPEQFEIVGLDESFGRGVSNGLLDIGSTEKEGYLKGERQFARVFIKHRR